MAKKVVAKKCATTFHVIFLILQLLLPQTMDQISLPDATLHALSNTHFAISKLTEAQLESVRRAVKGESVFVFTPTASGKTLCFYLVPFVRKSLEPDRSFRVIVVSPLIELMKDQVNFLTGKGHTAAYLCSDNKSTVLPTLKDKKPTFLFVTPEQAIADDVKKVLGSMKDLCLVVLDEAHVVLSATKTLPTPVRAPFKADPPAESPSHGFDRYAYSQRAH